MPCSLLRQAIVGVGLAVLAPATPRLWGGQASQQQAGPSLPIDKWNRMPPDVRERELAKLPPATARLIRQRLRKYNQMPPDEQQALRERYQVFSSLPPALRQVVRGRLREFNQLPPARRRVVYREVEVLGALQEAQRQARTNSPDFRSRFSPPEQQIIRDLTQYLEPPK